MNYRRCRESARIIRQFRRDAKLYGLEGPSKRIQQEWAILENKTEPAACFHLVKDMLSRMGLEERREHFSSLVNFFMFYASKYVGRIPENLFKLAFILLMEAARALGPDPVVCLLFLAKTELKMDADVFLVDLILPEHAGVVLRSFSALRSDPWGIRNNIPLMKDFKEWKLRSDALILYGINYNFENLYYHSRFIQLQDENFKVDDKVLQYEILPEIMAFGSLRMQLLLESLVALFTSKGTYERKILSLQWKAVPHPFISSSEMFALLEPFFKGEQLSLQEFCGHYKQRNTIFEVPEVTQPRSLKHLSRVQIRNSLFEANCIGEEAIDSLDIPHTLKGYLKLDWIPFSEGF